MSLKKYVDIYFRLRYLIEHKSTGTPEELSRKLGISTRQSANYIRDLRDLGHSVHCNSEARSYIFDPTSA